MAQKAGKIEPSFKSIIEKASIRCESTQDDYSNLQFLKTIVSGYNIYLSGDLMMTTKTKLADHLYQYNPNILDYFDVYDDDSGTFIPRAAVAALYPED